MKNIKKNINYFLLSFFIISIIFWILEMIYSLVIRNKFVLPGAWYGPYCPMYGLAYIFMLMVFKKEDNIVLNIIKIAITVILVEYIVSFISEKVFNNIIWDYSNDFMNINGRVCLKMSILFTIAGMILMYIFEPIIRKIYNKLSYKAKYLNIFLSIIMLVDILFTLL